LPAVELRNIRNFACKGVNLEVGAGELLALLGPNGAGKTTLLNVIAGLVPYEGNVIFDGVPYDDVPAGKRDIGYVFQDLVLFPHLDVRANVAYGLRRRGWARPRIENRVDDLLHSLGIRHLATRYPATLSGGEKQRVAFARAIAADPDVLLLDEPFNSVDGDGAGLLHSELKDLQRRLGITAILVTHDVAEAAAVADRVAIMHEGAIRRVGSPAQVLPEPGRCSRARAPQGLLPRAAPDAI